MKLPDLPRKNKRIEADITPHVVKWFEENWENSCAIEIKVGKNKVLPHQEVALKKVAKGTFSYKIPDMGNRICYDVFMLKDADAFVVRCDKRICSVLNVKNNEEFTIKV